MGGGFRFDEESLREFVDMVRGLMEEEREFVIATVVSVKGSAAARVGSKGVILPDGTVRGWLGGWCSENALLTVALSALKEGRPKLVKLVMSGETLKQVSEDVIEVGTPCGGEVLVYLEPAYPKPHIPIFGNNEVTKALSRLAQLLGFKVTVIDPSAGPEDYPGAKVLASLEDGGVRLDRHTYPVLATMGRTDVDVEVLLRILDKPVARVFLVASVNRAEEVLRRLARKGVPPDLLEKIESPAGIDLGAATPEELALSVLAGIVAARRGGSGRPMREARGDPVAKVVKELRRRAEATPS
ncbi:CoxF homolog [Aeropyrum pernix K1]|uniref:CoxF homolog n=1 Tax=Aeropyrum pernix (strain ATCC 700893 / DSM 11879 / JCM 9820 / NBRC 100138 / K1) TaxID=272557 RepID=Q9Y9R1_AERPE|nr:XdhC family protein [Aeropyrum pernix]BAA81239.1 CoxF homolog [Aeropyrum pernix K1]